MPKEDRQTARRHIETFLRAAVIGLCGGLASIVFRGGATEIQTWIGIGPQMIEGARQIRDRTGGFWTDQLNNSDQIPRYVVMGEEIWRQTAGRVDAFVQGVGTAGSLRGAAEALRRRNPAINSTLRPSRSRAHSLGPPRAGERARPP